MALPPLLRVNGYLHKDVHFFSQEAIAMSEIKFNVNVGIPTTFITKGGRRFVALEQVVSIPPAEAEVIAYLRELEVTTGAVTEIKAAAGIK